MLMELLNSLAASALALLPDSPFTEFIDAVENIPYLGYLNYFVPISDCLTLLSVWGAAVAVFYVCSAILRFVNATD